MSLYDKASLIMTPSGVKAEKLYSHKPHNGNGDFTHDRNLGTATRVNKDGLIETVAADVPRLDYPLIDGVVQDCPALLLEPARTNKFLYSEDLTQFDLSSSGTGAADPTITSNYAISPDGTQNADRVQFNAGTDSAGYSRVTDSFTIFATEETISVYLKSNDEQEYVIDIIQSNQALDTVTVTSEWQRFSFTRTNGSPDTYGVGLTNQNGGQTADILAWGFQLETGSYPTSYIPTSGTTVTRNADVCDSAGTSAEFNDSEGVLYAEIAALADEQIRRFISISDASEENRVGIRYHDTGSNAINFNLRAANSVVIGSTFSVNDITTFSKVAFKYKSNDSTVFIDGFKKIDLTTQSFVFNDNLDTLSFDKGDGGNDFYGKTKELAVFKEALTDSELEALTSWDSFNDMAVGQEYTIR